LSEQFATGETFFLRMGVVAASGYQIISTPSSLVTLVPLLIAYFSSTFRSHHLELTLRVVCGFRDSYRFADDELPASRPRKH